MRVLHYQWQWDNLSTNKFPVIYLQNSGIGNLINPYNSLLNENIYKIPFYYLLDGEESLEYRTSLNIYSKERLLWTN